MYVLGISGAFQHDAAACLLYGARVVAMAEEERFRRLKGAFRQRPVFSALFCLRQAGITLSDVHVLAVSWDPALSSGGSAVLIDYVKEFLEDGAWVGFHRPTIAFVPHHVAHAASAYYVSGYDEAAVLVMDGHGERASTSIGYASKDKLTLRREFPISDSLGHFYEAACVHVGLGKDDVGKLMGLAAYGTPSSRNVPVWPTSEGYRTALQEPERNNTSHREAYSHVRESWKMWLREHWGVPNKRPPEWDPDLGKIRRSGQIAQIYYDIAATTQTALTEVVCHLAAQAISAAGCRNLVLSGGVALNCTANGEILRRGIADSVFVFPAAHDAGGALGAAAFVSGHRLEAGTPFDPYLGPSFDDPAISSILRRLGISHRHTDDIEEEAAKLIADGLVIGWLQGRMECGPRALGNRSILALPNSTGLRDRVNDVKGRERWRPLSPSVLSTVGAEAFPTLSESSYMLHAGPVSDRWTDRLAGVTHVDGSARPQVVREEFNPRFFKLLKEVERATSVGAVLNTSFNADTEPIVCTPLDAIRTFFSSEMDALCLGSFIVQKESGTCA